MKCSWLTCLLDAWIGKTGPNWERERDREKEDFLVELALVQEYILLYNSAVVAKSNSSWLECEETGCLTVIGCVTLV